MASQSAPSSPPIEALNAYDDSSFINEENSSQEHSSDSTWRPAFPAADDRGFNFHPIEVPRRNLLVNELPQSPFYKYLPTVFQCVESWSQHLQHVTTELCESGSHLTVNEAIIRYTGRNKQVTCVPNKPVDIGFKVEDVIYVATEAEAEIMALNSTQSVVIALINLLPISTYPVFVDNLFSSPDLFRSLCQHGHSATGTARSNCGIYNGLMETKKADKAGKSGFQFNEIKVILTADNEVNQVA
ncbi:ac transposable element-derived 2 [Fusarium acutatum]|uniref:Ac transposable element-derived 2 n=1 Tax=Fusarium acutatum TaxID=78861 RepID=A0A8H4JFZ3_9HYPO|nr:ac transposable element-derived 2 [Fusarium acutatum]